MVFIQTYNMSFYLGVFDTLLDLIGKGLKEYLLRLCKGSFMRVFISFARVGSQEVVNEFPSDSVI